MKINHHQLRPGMAILAVDDTLVLIVAVIKSYDISFSDGSTRVFYLWNDRLGSFHSSEKSTYSLVSP